MTLRPRGARGVHLRRQHLLLGVTAVLALALPAAFITIATSSATQATGTAPARSATAATVGQQRAAVHRPPARPKDRRPNIVLITTDDQNVDDLRYMPKTRRLLAGAGVESTGFFNPHPLCCPARAEILTGEYAQNNGVRHNNGPYGGYQAFTRNQRNLTGNIGAWLYSAGYRTAMVGKMLNGYGNGSGPKPAGWDRWNPTLRGTYAYYGTRFENDGRPVTYKKQYVSDVVTSYTNSYIKRFTSAGRAQRPFFIWTSHVGPHEAIPTPSSGLGPIPPKRYAGRFAGLKSPASDKPSYLEADRSDKPAAIRARHALGQRALDRLARLRAGTVLAIDDSVASIVAALRRSGELDNTIIVFTSDNGYLLGEHDVMFKNFPYEENLRVPFLVRGPGLVRGAVSDEPVTMVDIATTFLARAGALDRVRATGRTDGIDAWPVLNGRARANPTQLIQAGSSEPTALQDGGWRFRGVRTARYTYAHWYTGEEELYDNRLDPYQLDSAHKAPRYAAVLVEMRRRTAALVGCRGVQQCKSQDFGPDPAPTPLPPVGPRPGAGTPIPTPPSPAR